MSYNGIGLRTVRGSGTNGYIQKNRSSISHLHRNDNPPDLKPPVAKKPNAEIINHERKRQIELKVLLYEEKLKGKKTPKDEIKKLCGVLREQLQEQFARDPSAMKINLNESHQKNAAKHKEDAKLRNAFEIGPKHVEGAAYEQIGNPGYMARDTFGKAAAIAAAKAKQKEKEEKELTQPKLPSSFLGNAIYSEEEYRARKQAKEARERGYRGDHWRPHERSRSRSRSRSRDDRRGKGVKRSRSPAHKRSRSFESKKKREKSHSPPQKKKAAEQTVLSSLLLPQGAKKAKKQKKQTAKGKKKVSESDSGSSSSGSSSSDSSSGSDSSSSTSGSSSDSD